MYCLTKVDILFRYLKRAVRKEDVVPEALKFTKRV